jgi:hypothetical protein
MLAWQYPLEDRVGRNFDPMEFVQQVVVQFHGLVFPRSLVAAIAARSPRRHFAFYIAYP